MLSFNKTSFTVIVIVLTMMLLVPEIAFAAEKKDIPNIAPDSPFYFVKRWGERVRIFIAFSQKAKAEIKADIAEERLKEARFMMENDNAEEAGNLIKEYKQDMKDAIKNAEEVKKEEDVNPEEVGKIFKDLTKKQSKHIEVLGDMVEEIPEEYKKNVFETIRAGIKNMNRNGDNLNEIAEKMPANAKYKLFRILKDTTDEIDDTNENVFRFMDKMPPDKKSEIESTFRAVKEAMKKRNEVLRSVFDTMPPEALEEMKQKMEEVRKNQEAMWEKMKEEGKFKMFDQPPEMNFRPPEIPFGEMVDRMKREGKLDFGKIPEGMPPEEIMKKFGPPPVNQTGQPYQGDPRYPQFSNIENRPPGQSWFEPPRNGGTNDGSKPPYYMPQKPPEGENKGYRPPEQPWFEPPKNGGPNDRSKPPYYMPQKPPEGENKGYRPPEQPIDNRKPGDGTQPPYMPIPPEGENREVRPPEQPRYEAPVEAPRPPENVPPSGEYIAPPSSGGDVAPPPVSPLPADPPPPTQ